MKQGTAKVRSAGTDRQEMSRELELLQWIMNHPKTIETMIGAYCVAWVFLLWNCLQSEEGIERLTWLVALVAVPLFGPIFYVIDLMQRERSLQNQPRL